MELVLPQLELHQNNGSVVMEMCGALRYLLDLGMYDEGPARSAVETVSQAPELLSRLERLSVDESLPVARDRALYLIRVR